MLYTPFYMIQKLLILSENETKDKSKLNGRPTKKEERSTRTDWKKKTKKSVELDIQLEMYQNVFT